MTKISGSYPLMNMAAEFGVDYADVLLMSDAVEAEMRQQWTTPGRLEVWDAALGRIRAKLKANRLRTFGLRISFLVQDRCRWRK